MACEYVGARIERAVAELSLTKSDCDGIRLFNDMFSKELQHRGRLLGRRRQALFYTERLIVQFVAELLGLVRRDQTHAVDDRGGTLRH